MLISDFAIKRPLITVVSMVALVVFGLFALWQLKTDEFPDVSPPYVVTTVIYPGASPEQVEREILEPVEEAIQGISGVDKVFGEARDGYAQIITAFVFEKPLQEATQDIRDAISLRRADLPQEMEEPILRRLSPNDRPIIILGLSSETLTPNQLTRVADPTITRELRSITGVSQVDVIGKLERELTVELKPQALASAGVSVGEVVQALQAQNLAVPVGRVEGALDERSIRLKGRLETPQDFAQLVVSERNGQLIRLGQVAEVKDGTEEQRTLAIFNGREAIGITIAKAKGYSTTDVSARVQRKVDELLERGVLPAGAKLDVINDAGIRVEASVDNVKMALIEGALLTVLVVFLFLNSWRSTVITGLALPVSVLASFIAVWVFGFTLNTMSLLGLSLAIGILIDDAIVVRENIVRHVEMGKDHFTAAREGTDEIGLAVAATTFSIVAVFVPVAFMYGEAGMWFKPFALTIACSVLVSLFVSFSLDPMLSAYWPDPHVPEHKKAWITRKLDTFNNWFNRQAENYRKVIAWALDHRFAMIVLAIGSLVAAVTLGSKGITGMLFIFGVLLAMIAVVQRLGLGGFGKAAAIVLTIVVLRVGLPFVPAWVTVGGGFFPGDDRSEMYIGIETPPGSNLDYTRLKAEEAARIARGHPEVLYTFTTLGGQSGAVDEGSIYVRLKPKHERAIGAEEFAAVVREEVKQVGGATLSVFTNDFQGDQKQIQVQVRGTETVQLQRVADQILAELQKIPGAVDVGLSSKGQKPELEVAVNRGLAGQLGVSVGQVAQSLRPAFAGIDAGDWVDPSGETRDVTVRLSPESRTRAADLQQLPLVIRTAEGGSTTVPLGQVAGVNQGLGPTVINHIDRDKVINVEANVDISRASLNDILGQLQPKIDAIALPPGVRVTQGGETESQAEVFGRILAALGIAIMLMYLILVMQFGSFLEPLAILVSLPLSLIGVMLSLALTKNTINIMSMIGMILLAGIVAKNAILLIDFAKWSVEKQGLSLRDALIEAGAIRLRPILMTTFALIAGMIPVALGRGEGAQFRAPLGVAVIGGTLTSTLLTLLVIPTVYEILIESKHWIAARLGLGRKAHEDAFRGAGETGEWATPTGD